MAGPTDTQQAAADNSGPEEFKLLDIAELQPSTSYSSSASAGPNVHKDGLPPTTMQRIAFTGVNVFVSCAALAAAKQVVNPANFYAANAAQETSNQLPAWFKGQYRMKRISSGLYQSIMKDTGILVAASATWYGVQYGMKVVRGKDDAVNVCTAGSMSAALLGAAFIEPFRWSRTGIWGLLGGVIGYYGYQEQQNLKAALLKRQQELEQKHMHKRPDEVHISVNTHLLKQLLEMEQQAQMQQLQSQVQQSQKPEEWDKLMASAPWLQDEQPLSDQQQS